MMPLLRQPRGLGSSGFQASRGPIQKEGKLFEEGQVNLQSDEGCHYCCQPGQDAG